MYVNNIIYVYTRIQELYYIFLISAICGSFTGIPHSSSWVFVKRHILLTKGLIQAHSVQAIEKKILNIPELFFVVVVKSVKKEVVEIGVTGE